MKHAKSFVGIFVAILAFSYSVYTIVTFEYNPHCDQRVSLKIAALDMEPHPEDKGPIIYEAPYAIPLRVFYFLAVFAFLAAPLYLAKIAFKEGEGRISILKPSLVLTFSLLTHIVISLGVAGERFSDVNFVVLLLVALQIAAINAVRLSFAVLGILIG